MHWPGRQEKPHKLLNFISCLASVASSSAQVTMQSSSAQVSMQSSSAEVTMQSPNRKRAPAWTEREVLDLIALCGDESVLSELHSKRRNAKIFEKISKGMKDRGYSRDPQQCCMKLKELSQAYKRTREANGCSGSEPQTCRFYDELHAILGGASTTTPVQCMDSVNGLSYNRDADLGDKEDEEEEEVEAQQASGETVSPDSQELVFHPGSSTLPTHRRRAPGPRRWRRDLW
ncbi:hypothetical protein UY3_00277 [Chelonia mydas]|uniref:Myb/SANT-like DNA-binding domain-containing protein n=1 Tax=Chelonia mydas TaxID=8469 RepID=M7CCK0_CHEMY|nr:hypothetical protein UY3_00277 [Chelonia mydas]